MNYRDRLKKADNDRKRQNLRSSGSGSGGYTQVNVFLADGSFTSETSSGCDTSSSSSYDGGSSSSSDCGGGSYGE